MTRSLYFSLSQSLCLYLIFSVSLTFNFSVLPKPLPRTSFLWLSLLFPPQFTPYNVFCSWFPALYFSYVHFTLSFSMFPFFIQPLSLIQLSVLFPLFLDRIKRFSFFTCCYFTPPSLSLLAYFFSLSYSFIASFLDPLILFLQFLSFFFLFFFHFIFIVFFFYFLRCNFNWLGDKIPQTPVVGVQA